MERGGGFNQSEEEADGGPNSAVGIVWRLWCQSLIKDFLVRPESFFLWDLKNPRSINTIF